MSVSFGFLFGTASLFSRTAKPTSRLLSSVPSPSKLLPSLFLHFQCHFSSSAADAAAETVCFSPLHPHPWPEWVSFVDHLKTKGYFTRKAENRDAADDAALSALNVYSDINQLKDPCLSFARDRYDVFKSLSTSDIETIVKGGCPNLLRKAVNSAKRLRAYVHLDEGDVCGACNLRGSCDRAYVILKDTEADARTVDVVRILLFYALNPLVISGGEKPAGIGAVETAVRKLISELIELSMIPPDPSLPKPTTKSLHQKERKVNLNGEKLHEDNVEMKRGDWMCPKCDFMNFARNLRCKNCNEKGPKSVGYNKIEMKKGDWICSKCNFMNFWRNKICLKCKADGPRIVNVNDVEMKKGDWNCSLCGFMNFANNKSCLRCQEPRPKRHMNPREWECPLCDYLNYSRNTVCHKCSGKRPKGVTVDDDEQI